MSEEEQDRIAAQLAPVIAPGGAAVPARHGWAHAGFDASETGVV
jgi:hypothetical protein